MTTTTRNEAAERLRSTFSNRGWRFMYRDLDDALAAERRATVKRIEGLDRFTDDSGIEYVELAAIRTTILDEEAAR